MACWRLLQAVFLLGVVNQCVHGGEKEGKKDNKEAEQVALPGDPSFCVDLQTLSFSEGSLKPEFAVSETVPGAIQSTSNYELTINDEKATSLLITPELQLSKYNFLHKPLLRVDGKDKDYSPIETIQIPIKLNETIGEFKRTLTLELLDPQPGGWFSTQRGHKYIINIAQKPDIEDIVRPIDIKVWDQGGQRILGDPPFDAESGETRIHFLLPDKSTSVSIWLECKPEATSLSYGGTVQALGTSYQTSLDRPAKSVLVQCQYENDRWTKKSVFDRTYVVTLMRNPDSADLNHTKVDLLIWPPEDGTCSETKTKNRGFECADKQRHEVSVIAAYNNTKASLDLVDKTDHIEYRMYNGLPTRVPLGREYELALKAGKREAMYFPVKFENVAMCNTFSCPKYYELMPHAEKRICKRSTCTVADDRDFCCQHRRATCSTLKCSANLQLRKCASVLYCHTDPCSEQDENKCCTGDPNAPGDRYCTQEFMSQLKNVKKMMCNAFQCPEGYELKQTARHIPCLVSPCDAAADKLTCCQEVMYCDLMQCPKGYTNRFNAALFPCKSKTCEVEVDRDTCCTEVAYCDTFTCPPGFFARDHQELIGCAGNPCQFGDASTCCTMQGMCDTFICPKGTYRRDEAYRTPCIGYERHVCDSPMDEFFCCDISVPCTGFRCGDGWELKAGAENIFCAGAACSEPDKPICCDMLNPFAAGDFSVVPKTGDGECSKSNPLSQTSFYCKASGNMLRLTVEIKFVEPVKKGFFIGGTEIPNVSIEGDTALIALPAVNVTKTDNMEYAMVAHVPGQPDVHHALKVTIDSEALSERRRLGSEDQQPLLWH